MDEKLPTVRRFLKDEYTGAAPASLGLAHYQAKATFSPTLNLYPSVIEVEFDTGKFTRFNLLYINHEEAVYRAPYARFHIKFTK